jgi:hypothetical protein
MSESAKIRDPRPVQTPARSSAPPSTGRLKRPQVTAEERKSRDLAKAYAQACGKDKALLRTITWSERGILSADEGVASAKAAIRTAQARIPIALASAESERKRLAAARSARLSHTAILESTKRAYEQDLEEQCRKRSKTDDHLVSFRLT